MTPSEKSVQKIGIAVTLTIIGMFGIFVLFWIKGMVNNTLMGESPVYKAHIPAAPALDITQAPQCTPGYERPWIGCFKTE